VLGYDESSNARRAVDLMSRLEPGRGSSVLLVKVIDPIGRLPSAARLPVPVRGSLRREIASLNRQRREQAHEQLRTAAARLKRSGWTTETEVLTGSPLEVLLTAARARRADVLVVGARETSGVKRALLGSVAEGILNHSRTPVLLVR
jgi:nucleotide-binding universal stress UspA family protein